MYAPMAPTYPASLFRHIKAFKPELILVHMPNVSGFWSLFLPLPCPLAIYWHADVIFPRKKVAHNIAYKGYSIFERALLRKADSILVSSPPYLEHSLPLREFRTKCEVVPLGIDTDRIPQITENGIAEVKKKVMGDVNAQYVYAAGRFAHYKGFDRLIRAAAETRTSLPYLKYVIAGDGETRAKMLHLVDACGLSGHVFLPGHISDNEYWALMKGCKMFCLPSIERTEAFGVVLLEAMAMGKPCISTNIPGSGTGWVNRHGETGLVVPPDDVQALVEAVTALLSKEAPVPVRAETLPLSIEKTTKLILNIGKEAGNA